ncbi:MAG: biopolymer transporter ExbD [Desulfotalea sp.]|nr:MAG: biopolymer transporter ExbD [Desulfotalea sp.]
MINVGRTKRQYDSESMINMAPLVDLIFLLLIFFIVTTSFVRETGIEVDRPSASTAVAQQKGNILIGISEEGLVFFDNKEIDVRAVRAHVERALAETPETGVVIVADRASHTGVVIQVMDQCRLSGAKNVAIAAAVKEL